jgi:anti-anti-sigma factor
MDRSTAHIDKEIQGEVGILHLREKYLGGKERERLLELAAELISQGYCRIVIDLALTDWLSTDEMGGLVPGLVKARDAGGDMVLAGPKPASQKMLAATGLGAVYRVFGTVDEAVQSFALPPHDP